MQLLRSSTAPAPEFASVSLLLKPEDSRDEFSATLGDPFVVASPLATVSSTCVTDALTELHTHLTYVIKASATRDTDEKDSFTVELLKNDGNLLSGMQVFRPISASGLGLYYRLIQGNSSDLSTFSTLGLASYQSSSSAAKVDPSRLHGAIFCVGVSGLALSHCSSSLQYSMSQRMNDCIGIISRGGSKDVAAAKSILSSFLLLENEYQTTNALVDARNAIAIPTVDKDAQRKSRRSTAKTGAANPNAPALELVMPMTMHPNSADVARNMIDRLTVLSVAETDTFLRPYEVTGQERRANLDLLGGTKKKKFRRRKGDGKEADFDNFDYKGPKRTVEASRAPISNLVDSPEASSQATFKKDLRKKASSVPVLSASRTDAVHAASRPRRAGDAGSLQFVDNDAESRPSGGSVSSMNRVQINIALNEDLSCSYKESQLSSCVVEGAIQVQIKASGRSAIPFHLFLRDPSSHLGVLQENKKYAEISTEEPTRDDEEGYSDRRFTVRLPNGDSYFPILRYKCLPDLRPVPIRVQTRVKLDGSYCRVALQISSNPNNSTSLTDLTIIMSVPDLVVGESIVTQPPGGVWDESKSSAIWCVSELGGGEKFQLQAAFDTVDDEVTGEDLSFPVMVRCQSLFSQLSDIEVEVRDIPEVAPAEMSMKIARRFRLSHREKS